MSQSGTLSRGSGSGGIITIQGDVGSVTGPTIDLFANPVSGGSADCGSSVLFNAASATELDLVVSDANDNVIIGAGSGNAAVETGCNQNVSVGSLCLSNLTTGSQNSVLGHNNLPSLLTGDGNIVLGNACAQQYVGAESYNIIINAQSTASAAESNMLRIGDGTGTGANQIAGAYISGINGVDIGATANVVTVDGFEHLGSAVITAGSGITVTTGSNTITVSATGGGVSWSTITADQTAVVNTGVFADKAGTLAYALPATSAVGDIIEVANINTATGVQFTQAAGQQIFFAGTSTTLGATGTLTSTAVGDTLKMVCRVANTTWMVLSSIGNWTVV